MEDFMCIESVRFGYLICEPYDTYVEVEEKDFCSNGERKR